MMLLFYIVQEKKNIPDDECGYYCGLTLYLRLHNAQDLFSALAHVGYVAKSPKKNQRKKTNNELLSKWALKKS